jgi:hypothetical protein
MLVARQLKKNTMWTVVYFGLVAVPTNVLQSGSSYTTPRKFGIVQFYTSFTSYSSDVSKWLSQRREEQHSPAVLLEKIPHLTGQGYKPLAEGSPFSTPSTR